MTRIGLIAMALAGLSALQSVSAHYQLTYPQSRGFNEDTEPTAPCGGFNSVSSRSQFPLQNGFVQINSGHTDYTYEVKLVTNSTNPTTSDFTSASTVAKGSRNYPADACLPIDLSNVQGVAAGANATIQVVYDGGDGLLYQCADITLAENPSSFNTSACFNADGSNPTAAPSTGSGSDENGASVLSVTSGVLAAAIAAALSIAA